LKDDLYSQNLPITNSTNQKKVLPIEFYFIQKKEKANSNKKNTDKHFIPNLTFEKKKQQTRT